MNKFSPRNLLCRYYRNRLKKSQTEFDKEDLKKSAIVFSPHFDDETLGCGGTIIKKKQAGANVKIVFMTDGSTSHKHLISEKELKKIRIEEANAAAQTLGLEENDVFCLNFTETHLNEHLLPAVEQVTWLINQWQPEQIFIPYSKEPLLWSEDHLATTKIVKTALQKLGRDIVVYEYPIWFWFHWPWVSLRIRNRVHTSTILKNSIAYNFGLSLLKDFNFSVSIDQELQNKRVALDQHKSQMTRLLPNKDWTTLGDMANGEFLDCFFQSHEIFCVEK